MQIRALLLAVAGLANAQQSAWGQCGGIGYSGASSCVAGYYCYTQNPYYAQCTPGSGPSTTLVTTTSRTTTTTTHTTTTTSSTRTTTTTTTSVVPPPSTSSTTSAAPPPPPSGGSGKVKYAGVNMAGFDFGCGNDGTCNLGGYYDIVTDLNPSGIQQMNHLASLGLNAFRLPIGWQNMVNGVVGGPLNDPALTDYYTLVSACLAVAEWCEIDVHNYARWDAEVIGQGGPTNAQFANLWSQIATKYANESKIVFGVMNEPHDLPSIPIWAQTVQAAVTAIREAGATSQYILLPGNDYASAATFVSGGSAAALNAVTNPDGSITGLIMDVHKYLDSDNSGTTSDCVTDNIDTAFAPLATWLRANGRQAFLSETGAGNNAQCVTDMCAQLAYLNANSDVYLGWTGWAAGGFAGQNYALSEVPTLSNGVWTDTLLVTSCIAGEFVG